MCSGSSSTARAMSIRQLDRPLARNPKHQVEVEPLDARGAKPRDRLDDLRRPSAALERLQEVRLEALRTQRYTRPPRLRKRRGGLLSPRLRVALDGHLAGGRERPQKGEQEPRPKQRGGAAADEDGLGG